MGILNPKLTAILRPEDFTLKQEYIESGISYVSRIITLYIQSKLTRSCVVGTVSPKIYRSCLPIGLAAGPTPIGAAQH